MQDIVARWRLTVQMKFNEYVILITFVLNCALKVGSGKAGHSSLCSAAGLTQRFFRENTKLKGHKYAARGGCGHFSFMRLFLVFHLAYLRKLRRFSMKGLTSEKSHLNRRWTPVGLYLCLCKGNSKHCYICENADKIATCLWRNIAYVETIEENAAH